MKNKFIKPPSQYFRPPSIGVDEKVPFLIGIPLSIQHLFAMFGASVLVPALFGINPAIVLLMNGIGTLGYLIICKGRVPAFLGSSFAFIPPVLLILGTNKALWPANYPLALGGFIVAGLMFIIVSLLIKFFGKILPLTTRIKQVNIHLPL